MSEIKDKNYWENIYMQNIDVENQLEFGYNDKTSRTFGEATFISPKYIAIAEYLVLGLQEKGYNETNYSTAKSGTIYVKRHYGADPLIRISDHMGRTGIYKVPYDNITNIAAAKEVLNHIKTVEEVKEINRLANEKEEKRLEPIKNLKFPDGYGYKNSNRTYQDLETFKTKFPNAIHIKQNHLHGGAFDYDYLTPKDEYSKTEFAAPNEYKFYLLEQFQNQKIKDTIILYHGSNIAFTEFDEKRISTGESGDLFGKGFYLTNNENVAKYYAHQVALKDFVEEYTHTGILGTQEPVYKQNAQELAKEKEVVNAFQVTNFKLLNTQEFIIDQQFKNDIIEIISTNLLIDKESINKTFDFLKNNRSKIKDYRGELTYVFSNMLGGNNEAKKLINTYIQNLGYDGIVYPSDLSYEGKEALNYVIFNKNILKPYYEKTNPMENNYNQTKFEHFKNKWIKNLDFTTNLNFETKNNFINIIKEFRETDEFKKNPDTYSFTKFKEDVSKIEINVLEKYIYLDEEHQRFYNFNYMAQFNPIKQFIVFPKDKNFSPTINQNQINNTYSFEDFKKNISLPDFMEMYGFKNTKGGTNRYPKMKNDVTGEMYVIKKNSKGHYTFFDPINEMYKGATIIDFVLDRHKNDKSGKIFTIQDAGKILNDYIKGDFFVNPENSSYKLVQEKIDENKFQKEINGLKPITNRNFLYSRKINDTIIDSPIFKTKIYNHVFIDENQNSHINTAFVMQNIEGKVAAISKRNDNFKGIGGEKSVGIFISNDPSKGEQLDKLFILESALDCLSHYQLNYNDLINKKIRYISTEGDFAEGQTNIISKIINKQQPKELIFGQDNDLAGTYEITKILRDVKLIDKKNEGHFIGENIDILTHRSKLDSFVEFNFKCKNEQESNTFIQKTTNYFNEANIKLNGVSHESKPFNLSILSTENNITNIRIDLQNHQYNWEQVNQFIINIKYNSINMDFQREKPISKDFNDDLKNSFISELSYDESEKNFNIIKNQYPQNIDFNLIPVSDELIKDIAKILKTDSEIVDYWMNDNLQSKNYYIDKFVDTLHNNKQNNIDLIQKWNKDLIGYDMNKNIQSSIINITNKIEKKQEYKREIPPLKLYSKLTSDYDTVDFKTIYIATDSKFFYKSYDSMIDVNNLQDSKWEQITNEMYNKLSTQFHTENMIVYPFSDLKGELEGESTKIFIGKDLNGELYKSYNIYDNILNTKQWQQISLAEYKKLESILSQKFYNRTQEEIDKVYNNTHKDSRNIIDGKKYASYLEFEEMTVSAPIEMMPEKIFQEKLEEANKNLNKNNNISL